MLQQHQIGRYSSSVFKGKSDEEDSIFQEQSIDDQEAVQASNNLIYSHPIQAKMLLGNSQDRYEKEADETAQMVLHSIEERGPFPVEENQSTPNPGSITSPASFSQQEQMHLSGTPSAQNMLPTERTHQINQVIQGTGHSISGPLRSRMEYGFGGEDFSRVQMHTTPKAIAAAQSIGAKAFTVGHHIVGDVRQPEVLAHELQHVRQQSHQSANPNIPTVQCMLNGTLSDLRTEAGEPSRKAKAKSFMTFGLAKSTYTQIMEAIFQYEMMEDEVEAGFDPPPIGTCLRMLEEITDLIDQWFAANEQGPERRLRRSDLSRGETLSRVRELVVGEYGLVRSLGHPDVLRLRPRENEAQSRSTTTQGLENVHPPRYSQLPPDRYSQLFPDGPPPNFLGEGNLDTIPEEGNNIPPVPPRPPRPVRPRTTSAGARLRLGTASSNAPWIQPRPEPSSSPPPIPLRTTQTRPSTPPPTSPSIPPPIPQRPWQNTASNVASHSSHEPPPRPPRGVSNHARPLPSSFFSPQGQQDRTRRHVPVPTTVETNPELSVGAPPSYGDAVGVGRQELRPALWQKLMPSWTKATAIDNAIFQMISSTNRQEGLAELAEPLTNYSNLILSSLKKAYAGDSSDRVYNYIRRAYGFTGTLRHYVEQANDLSMIDRSTYEQITTDITQLSRILHQLYQNPL